jgi:hypothetical protein
MEINLNHPQLTEALISYLHSQEEYNEAAIQRMAYETKLQEERLATMNQVREELTKGMNRSGVTDLNDLLDPSDDDEGTL